MENTSVPYLRYSTKQRKEHAYASSVNPHPLFYLIEKLTAVLDLALWDMCMIILDEGAEPSTYVVICGEYSVACKLRIIVLQKLWSLRKQSI